MAPYAVLVIASLAFILAACAVFVNAVEWLGKKLGLHQGIVGSILAAVGTALPETIIPIIAIVFTGGEKATQIGIGAIAGAPFMLGTLAFFVTGSAVIIYRLLGKRTLAVQADLSVISRDLVFFIAIYGVAVLTTFVHEITALRISIAILLMLSYALYLKVTFAGEGKESEHIDVLYATRYVKCPTCLLWIWVQLIISLLMIIAGAHYFIVGVEKVSAMMGIAPLILSIIITPIATELPEKLNSVIWIGKRKDTLALGNITGAMVFQSCFPVVFGIIFTPWDLRGVTMISAVMAFSSTIFVLLWIRIKKSLNPFVLLAGGLFYVLFLVLAFRHS